MGRRRLLFLLLGLSLLSAAIVSGLALRMTPPLVAQEEPRFLFCPPQSGWAMTVWLGPDNTPTIDATATCRDALILTVWWLNPDTQQWESYTTDPDVPEFARGTLTSLFHLQPVIVQASDTTAVLLEQDATSASIIGFSGVNTVADSWYRDNEDRIHIVGEVKNNQPFNVHNVEIIASFLDASGRVVAAASAPTCLGVIPARGDSPFHIVLDAPPSGISNYVLSLVQEPTNLAPSSGITLTIEEARLQNRNIARIRGTVTNVTRNVTLRSVQVCAALYDHNGTVVRAGSVYSTPSTLIPSQSGAFDYSETVGSATVTGYRLWTRSE